MPRTTDKRERLVHSADQLILRQGFKQTTLADIAEDSGVPLGNVYYYFKSKEDIGMSVIDVRLQHMRDMLHNSPGTTSPRERLQAVLDYPLSIIDTLTTCGCPLGTLAYELSRVETVLRKASRQLISEVLEWSTEQFREMGRADAEDLGLQFVASLQGMSLVANTLGDPDVVTRMVARTREWLDTL